MKLSTDQIKLIIFALDREMDLEDMGYEEIIKFAKEENGQDPLYKIELQEIVDKLESYIEKESTYGRRERSVMTDLFQQHILKGEKSPCQFNPVYRKEEN